MGFYALVYEEGSKYDVTRRERPAERARWERPRRQQWARARGGCGEGPNPLGEGLRAQRGGVEAEPQSVLGLY